MSGPLCARAHWVAAALCLCFFLTGCGTSKSKVSGKVTAQGKTVVWGSVTLVDQTGAYYQGDIDLNGNYTIDNVPAGPVKIAVASPNPDQHRGDGGAKGGDAAAKGGDGGAKGGTKGGRIGPKVKTGAGIEDPREKFLAEKGGKNADAERPRPPAGAWFALDLKFADPATSGLTGEVKAGTTELNIDVK